MNSVFFQAGSQIPPALRYFGGKHRDASKIIDHFPPHDVYCEPFGGGASVLLQKYPANIEIYNDINNEVVNFFQVLRDRPQELIQMILLTPYSRKEKELAYEKTENPLESARRLYIRSWQGFGGDSLRINSGWRYLYQQLRGEDVVQNFNRTDHLWLLASRLKEVQIEHDDAITVIKRYGRNPKSLLYCDPPYVHSTRTDKSVYAHEMTNEQHTELSVVLHSVKAMVAISGYECELYQALYQGWKCVRWNTQKNGNKQKATECLWLSPNCEIDLPLLKLLDNS